MAMVWLTNIYLWIGIGLFSTLMFGLSMIFIIILGMKTHAVIEFKAWIKGRPIALFFQENRYCEWKPVEPDAGIIIDKKYGAFIVNERATYIDKTTKNVLIPFDAAVGTSVNVHAAKLIDDLSHIIQDDEEMKALRIAIAKDVIKDTESVNVLKTSIHFGAIKNMMTAIIPHSINAKIEKELAARTKGFGNVNVQQVVFLFVAILGAIILGTIIIKSVLK